MFSGGHSTLKHACKTTRENIQLRETEYMKQTVGDRIQELVHR